MYRRTIRIYRSLIWQRHVNLDLKKISKVHKVGEEMSNLVSIYMTPIDPTTLKIGTKVRVIGYINIRKEEEIAARIPIGEVVTVKDAIEDFNKGCDIPCKNHICMRLKYTGSSYVAAMCAYIAEILDTKKKIMYTKYFGGGPYTEGGMYET